MLRIRLARLGRKKRPFYRMVVLNEQARREGAAIAVIGFYDPIQKQLRLNTELAQSWIAKGAQVSDSANRLLKLATESNTLIQLPKKERKELAIVKAAPEVSVASEVAPAPSSVESAPESDAAE
jgi:small subunit ribosomal protein S16